MRLLLVLLLISPALAGCAEMIPDPPVEENKPVCEEIAEIMNIMFDKAWDYVKNEDDDESKTTINHVKSFIKLYASKRPSYKPGLTNNTIFKFMDIEEKYM